MLDERIEGLVGHVSRQQVAQRRLRRARRVGPLGMEAQKRALERRQLPLQHAAGRIAGSACQADGHGLSRRHAVLETPPRVGGRDARDGGHRLGGRRNLRQGERCIARGRDVARPQGVQKPALAFAQVRAAARMRVQHLPAAHHVHGRHRPHDEAVAARQGQGIVQAYLRVGTFAGLHGRAAVHEKHAPRHFGRAVRHAHPRAGFQPLAASACSQIGHPRVEAVGGTHGARRSQEHARPHVGRARRSQVERHAVAGLRHVDGNAVLLHASHAGTDGAGEDFHLVARRHPSAPKRPRDHRARTAHGEHAVHRQAQVRAALRPREAAGGCGQGGAQLVQPRARASRDRHHGSVRIGCAKQAGAYLVGHERSPFVVHQIGLRERHHAARHAQKLPARTGARRSAA